MKILHFYVSKHLLPGIKKQLDAEQCAAFNLPDAWAWSTVVFSLDEPDRSFMRKITVPRLPGFPQRLINYMILKKKAYRWLIQNQHRYDVIVLRYLPGDPFLAFAIRKLHTVCTIHHTMELAEINSLGGVLAFFHGLMENFIGPYVLNKVSGIIGLTDEITDFEIRRCKNPGIPRLCVSNGLMVDSIKLASDYRSTMPEFIFIASIFSEWHGLDKVLTALSIDKSALRLHIVGQVSDEQITKDQRIVYHGLLNTQQITELCAQCDLGLGSFALERKQMREACTLKVREYLAQGLPVYAGHKDVAFPEDFPYFNNQEFSVECAINLAEYYKPHSRLQVREAAIPYIDKQRIVFQTAEWLGQVVDSCGSSRQG